eukprot:5975718-Prorocentrum_lima.AAC.1
MHWHHCWRSIEPLQRLHGHKWHVPRTVVVRSSGVDTRSTQACTHSPSPCVQTVVEQKHWMRRVALGMCGPGE